MDGFQPRIPVGATLLREGRDFRHGRRSCPKTRLRQVRDVKQAIRCSDLNEVSRWRIHPQCQDGDGVLKDVIEGQLHGNILRVVKTKKGRYR